MAMVKVNSGLIRKRELVGVFVPRFDGPLSNARDAIVPVFVDLKYAMTTRMIRYRW